jgi:heme A synthase
MAAPDGKASAAVMAKGLTGLVGFGVLLLVLHAAVGALAAQDSAACAGPRSGQGRQGVRRVRA